MLFDKFCGFAEKHLPDMVPTLKACKVFKYEYNPLTDPKEYPDANTMDFLKDNFMLPFPKTAVENIEGVVIFQEEVPEQRGLFPRRKFTVVGQEPANPTPLLLPGDDTLTWARQHDSFIIAHGTIRDIVPIDRCRYWASCAVHSHGIGLFAPPKDIAIPLKMHSGSTLERTQFQIIFKVVLNAIGQLFYLYTPDHFLVEQAPVKSNGNKQNKTNGKVIRSHERPIYQVLKPLEARKVMGLGDPKPATESTGRKVLHRIAHTRTLRSERYVNKRGQTIMIPAIWNDAVESVVGKRRYRVVIDNPTQNVVVTQPN